MDAALFDILGILAFAFVVIVSLMQLNSRKIISRWLYWVLLAVGILGLIVDVLIVYDNFIR